MIRFSAALVAVAIGVLVGGIASSKLLIVYIAIVVSAVAMLALAIGVVLKREELFGGQGLGGQGLVPAAAGASSAPPALGGDSRRPGWPDGGDSRRPGWPDGGDSRRPGWPDGGDSRRPGQSAPASSPFATGTPGLGTAFGGIAAVASAPAGSVQAGATGNTALPWDSLPPPPAPQTADTGTDATPRSWFDRLGEPADANAPTAPPSAWAWTSPAGEPATGPSASPASAGSEATPGDGAAKPGKSGGAATPGDDAAQPGTSGGVQPGKAGGETATGKPADPIAPVSSGDAVAGDAVAGDTEPADAMPDDAVPGDPLPGPAVTPTAAGPELAAVPDGEGDQDDVAGPADEDVAWPEPAAPTVSVAVLGASARPSARPVPRVPGSSTAKAPATVAAPVIDPAQDDAGDTGGGSDGDEEPSPPDAPDAPDAETVTGSPEVSTVSVIRGVPRYHESDCVLIRFMPEGDIQKLSVPEAEAVGCTPCAACQPAH